MNGLALRPPSTCISVCSGVGGLDLGLHAACGVEPVVYIEREAPAAAILVARMADAALPSAPVWDDVCAFDARPLVGLVDLVAGGTPCQDLSLAGKRAGLHGERSRLFFEHVRVAVECAAPLFFWENVAGATAVVPLVAEHLASHGYTRAVWCVVRASDVGAPHGRARVFLLAYSECAQRRADELARRSGRQGVAPGRNEAAGEPSSSGRLLAYSSRAGREQRPGSRGNAGRASAAERGGAVADAPGFGRGEGRPQPEGQQGRHDAAERRSAVVDSHGEPLRLQPGRPSGENGASASLAGHPGAGLAVFPPGPGDAAGWARVLSARPDLAPATAQPRLRRLAHGLGAGVDVCVCPREDRLRAAGNGVVPAQAALAWRVLWDALGRRLTMEQEAQR